MRGYNEVILALGLFELAALTDGSPGWVPDSLKTSLSGLGHIGQSQPRVRSLTSTSRTTRRSICLHVWVGWLRLRVRTRQRWEVAGTFVAVAVLSTGRGGL